MPKFFSYFPTALEAGGFLGHDKGLALPALSAALMDNLATKRLMELLESKVN